MPGTDGWRQDAKCLGADINLFYPEEDYIAIPVIERFCDHCPVRETCLEDAIRMRDEEGIWGGMTGRQRKSVMKQRRRAARRKDEMV